MTYMQHLIKNWQVAFHALHDFFCTFYSRINSGDKDSASSAVSGRW